jgi:hypothetical protein
MAYGFVYLLGNSSMPCCYKIGRTEFSPHRRASELSSGTAVPTPFQVLCYIEAEDAAMVEAGLHSFLADFRINTGREFFRFSPAHMPWVVGLLANHPLRVAYAECEVWEFVPHHLPEENPWDGCLDEPNMTPIAPIDGNSVLRLVA